ncbi:MAG: hypothetical protein LBS50_10455 [Prevotellaceae bacterium]|jgi:hypothetical protein|nr:hypothetical protein [Prevotellaceae bacterium]
MTAIQRKSNDIQKERDTLFNLLLQKTKTKKKEFFETMRDMYIASNIDILTANEKKQFKNLTFQ